GPRLGRRRFRGGWDRGGRAQAAGPRPRPRVAGDRAGGRAMTRPADADPTPNPAGSTRSLARLALAGQPRRWPRGERPAAESYLRRHPHLTDGPELVLDLVYNEVLLRQEAGEAPRLEEYLERFPHLEDPLRIQFEVEQALGVVPATAPAAVGEPGG